MFFDILICFLTQIVSLILPIYIFGFIVYLCDLAFYRCMGGGAKAACIVTGFVGTPVHELSHALMCVLFGHKIVEIKLFPTSLINGEGGDENGKITLGYVNHSYNKRNVYQNIGNFFIGVAPIVVITALLALFLYLLTPDIFSKFIAVAAAADFTEGVGTAFSCIVSSFEIILSGFSVPMFYVFLLIGFFLAPHMNLSGADLKGSFSGLIFLLIALIIADVIVYFVSTSAFISLLSGSVTVGGLMINFFIIALVICLAEIVVAFILRFLAKLFHLGR